MTSFRFAGPLCRYRLADDIDDGTLCRQSSPIPGVVNRLSLWPELHEPGFLPAAFGSWWVMTEADKTEFAIIKKMPVMNRRHREYKTVSEYVSDRTLFFGSPASYAAFAADSDAELSNTKWTVHHTTRTLSSMLEFGSHPKQQQIFYRWVRKAYKRKFGNDANVPDMIRKGMSKQLEEKLAQVRASVSVRKIHAEGFHQGGFNPRPVKQPRPGRNASGKDYVLGTLSDHGTGMAVDIDDTRNAQLSAGDWTFIEKLTGKTVARSGRWKSDSDAEQLWNDIKSLNDSFVQKVASEVKRIETERAAKAKAAASKKPTTEAQPMPKTPTTEAQPKPKTPLQEVLGDHYSALSKWVDKGFFNLPVEVVLELHHHGFAWGVVYGNPDLHHFQLDQ